jgi:putative transcriptional regulator
VTFLYKGGALLNKVKDYRKQEGLSQLDLARKVNVARQTINLIENNKYNPSLALCIAIAKALNTDLNTLFWEEE